LKQELARQRDRLRKKGIRHGDWPKVDSLVDRARSQVTRGELNAAEKTLRTLDRELDRWVIGRAFVERKLRRLQKALARSKLEAKFSSQNRQILNHVVNNRFEEANAVMNHVLNRLGKPGRRKKEK
jgi:hypothetical protein